MIMVFESYLVNIIALKQAANDQQFEAKSVPGFGNYIKIFLKIGPYILNKNLSIISYYIT